VILTKFGYSEFEGTKKQWILKPFAMNRINLFTAKNAIGKTRTLNAVYILRFVISKSLTFSDVQYTAEFSDHKSIYKYSLALAGVNVTTEHLSIDGIDYITRNSDGRGKIYNDTRDKPTEFQLPKNYLALSKRDIQQYQYLERIHEWSQNIVFYSFGSSMNQEKGIKTDVEIYGISDIISEVFLVGYLEFGKKFQSTVLSLMNGLGYNLTYIDVLALKHQESRQKTISSPYTEYKLIAGEGDRSTDIIQKDMSQGMFRALSIIIHLTYHDMMKTPITILIDDIGEGLDFDRSTKLIKLLIDLAEKNDNIQLIMSTNDRFVMNAVPLEYWQVIQRKGGECQVFNYQNSKEKFDEFEYMGLNNFDFLATDFINSKWEKV
jgi:AAA15 family ATPase/GTPase